MPVIKNAELNRYKVALESRYNNLAAQIKGKPPNENIYQQYEDDPLIYAKEYREIDDLEIKLVINDFEGILKELKKIKSLCVKPHRRK